MYKMEDTTTRKTRIRETTMAMIIFGVWYFIMLSSAIIIYVTILFTQVVFHMNQILKDFIVIEGIDGAGTTTQSKLLKENLERRGKEVFLTAEPTSSDIGKLIRNVLSGKLDFPKETLSLLFSSDRSLHLFGKNGIIEHLERGYTVISDRYMQSTIAYQGLDLPLSFIRDTNPFPFPEYYIFLDISTDDAISRIDMRKSEKEIYEKREILEKVRMNYQKEYHRLPENVKKLRLEGKLSIRDTEEEILSFILS